MCRHDAVQIVVSGCKATVSVAVAALQVCNVHSVQILPSQTGPSRAEGRVSETLPMLYNSAQFTPRGFSSLTQLNRVSSGSSRLSLLCLAVR